MELGRTHTHSKVYQLLYKVCPPRYIIYISGALGRVKKPCHPAWAHSEYCGILCVCDKYCNIGYGTEYKDGS